MFSHGIATDVADWCNCTSDPCVTLEGTVETEEPHRGDLSRTVGLVHVHYPVLLRFARGRH